MVVIREGRETQEVVSQETTQLLYLKDESVLAPILHTVIHDDLLGQHVYSHEGVIELFVVDHKQQDRMPGDLGRALVVLFVEVVRELKEVVVLLVLQ